MTTRLPQAAVETAPVDPRALRVSVSDGTPIEVDALVIGPAEDAAAPAKTAHNPAPAAAPASDRAPSILVDGAPVEA